MRTAVLLLAVGATWYIAGMYRSAPLLALLVLELLLAAALWLLPFLLRRRLRLTFSQGSGVVEKGAALSCCVLADNSGCLPVGRLRLDLVAHYPQDKRAIFHQRLYGGAFGQGESGMDFTLTAPCCGLVELWLFRARVYDYLSIFSAKIKADEMMQIAVLPLPQPLRLTIEQGSGSPYPIQTILLAGDSQELRQLRPYQEGESARRVHWPLSARSGELWVREYACEDAPRMYLLLHTAGKRRRAEDWGRFYEVLSALTLGLLANAVAVEVCWREQQGMRSLFLQSPEEQEELLLRIYQAELDPAPPEPPLIDKEQLMTLDLDLVWTCGGETVCRFPQKNLEKVLAESQFVLYKRYSNLQN